MISDRSKGRETGVGVFSVLTELASIWLYE